ncbi:G5 domain-containing protein [Facklamia hominis]|uniref:G5 domain-containing protein n=2 Tax=Facklamia hominis TaxID=178214 RepID=UPI0029D410C2|nr:G5 domain-containing protein [Facklamia hominis]WPJ90227.1 G5 domain-containing protein [Facklamia hominis]
MRPEVDLPHETVQVQDEAASNPASADERQGADDSVTLALSDQATLNAVAQAQSTEPNYSSDEKEIKDYNKSERYKETDLQPGDTNQSFGNTDEKKTKDGFKFELSNPSETSPSKTKYGYQITIDKKTGQRTYTKVYVTDSGLIPVDPGEKPMMSEGDKLTPGSPDVTYKPDENTIIDAARTQRNLNYGASEETLKNINNKDNDSTSFGFKDNYTSDNPRVKFFGGSFALGYKVNPWPNENDKLEELKLNKNNYDPNKKYFVQGQDIDTGIKVDNVDENAKERLVGQVYNPITGKIVPGASAYIGDNGNVHVKLPDGALKKDESGKTVINENSIFNTPDYKALQNLDVKFFARPRTAEEFKKIAETPDEFGETGTYTETGAGSATIKHKGQDVVIDKQGIDRYDHYNLIGSFKLNLDDTRYYDQKFEDGNGDDTSKVTSSAVKPGEPFKVGIVEPENPRETDKSAEEMNAAEDKGEVSGRLIMDFINRENKGKAEADQWKVDVDPNDIANFTITPPKSAKAGDFIAIPLEYTYTNGSKDVHWFHFVVQESTYIKPEYDAQVNFPVNEQTSPATVTEDGKRIAPDHYTLPDTLETDEAGNKLATDDKGNKWTVKVDEKTGQVSAKPVDPTAFDGGEKLTVPVIAHYVDEQKPGEDITEEVHAYFVIEEKANMTPRYNAQAGKSGDQLSSDVILNTEDKYNRRPGKYTLDSPTYTDDKGNTWNVSIDENTGKVTATVPNAEEGKSIDGALLNVPVTAHYYEEDAEGNQVEAGTKKTEVQFVAYGTNGKVEKTVEVPFETKVEKDPNLKKGEIKVITEGKKGSKKVTYTIEDSKIVKEEEQELEAPQVREIHVGEGVNDGTHKIEEKVEVPFETEIQFDDSLAPGETKEIQKGEAGEKKRDITLTIEDGNVTKTEMGEFTETKAPKKRIIKVGRNTEGKVEHKEELPFKYKVEEVDTLKKGEYKIVKPGKVGTKTTTWTIKNSKVEGEPTVTEVAAEDALIQVGKGTNDGTHEVIEKKALDYKTVIEYDENMEAGQQEVVKEGNPGEQERTNTLVIKDGQVTETKEGEFKTTKEATDRVIKVGTKPVTKVVEKPFNTEYVYDENLESGKTEEVTPGKNGKVTITTTYDKDQKKVVTSETEEAGQNRVVKIGGKTNGTEKVKEEIPFEVEVRKDPSLKKGEWKYATDDEGNELKGEKGEQEKTLTIENSKVINTSEPTVTKKAKNAVILVGEEDYTGTLETKKTKAIEFETEYRVNNELKPGEVKEIQKGELGEEETTVTHTIVNGEVTKSEEGTPTQTKAPVKRIVEVGPGTTDGTHKIEEKAEVPYEVEIEFDDSLAPGEQKVTQEGVSGEKTRTTTLTIENSKVTNTEVGEFEVTKEPVKKIIKVGRNTEGKVEHKEELPFGYKVEEIEALKKGEYRIVKPGKVGTKTTTWTIENSKVVGEPTVTEDPAEDALIQVGKGTNDGTHEIVEKKNIDYKTIIEYDENLDAGQQEVVKEGNPGEQERTNTLVIKDGKVTETKEGEFKTTKEATDRVVKVGTKPVTKVVEKPFNTEYQYDENLEAGKTEEVTPGKNGKVTITTTYDKDQKKVVTSETEEKGQNRVVKIGGKTNGTEKVKEEIPFEVEVRKDPSLKKGEWKYATDDEGNELKGEKGEQEKTLTIVNSKVTETSEPTVTKKAKNAVILVGEGTNDGTHEVIEKKELPFETRYEYDDSLKPGEEKVVTPGSPGEQERTNTLVIKDGKVVETKEGEFKTTKEPQERLIKIGRKSTEGETTKTIEREIPYETKVIYDENLEAGFQKIEKEGKPGKEEVTITQKIKDSKPVGEATETTKTITEKEDRIVRIGVKPVVKETELGHDTEYRHNPELKAGETKVIEEGSKGSVKYTTTFNKETGKLEVKEERTEPKNKVVEYGSKTDGEFTYESEKAYDIIIRENPNLEAGKTNVIQEGRPGKTETTVKIENSKEVSRDTKTITEKQDKIIEIGTKNVCEIPPVDPEDPEKPGKEDPEKPGKEDPEKPGKEDPEKPGKEDPEKPGKEDPKDPSKPGEEDPKDPSKPGEEDPKDPNKPGEEDPKDPNKPGKENPKDPNKPGEEDPKDPNKPGEEDPKDPNKPGEEDPKDPNKPGEKDPKDPTNPANDPSTGEVEKAKVLPQTGEVSGHLFGAAALSILSGLGLIATQRRKKEEE